MSHRHSADRLARKSFVRDSSQAASLCTIGGKHHTFSSRERELCSKKELEISYFGERAPKCSMSN